MVSSALNTSRGNRTYVPELSYELAQHLFGKFLLQTFPPPPEIERQVEHGTLFRGVLQ